MTPGRLRNRERRPPCVRARVCDRLLLRPHTVPFLHLAPIWSLFACFLSRPLRLYPFRSLLPLFRSFGHFFPQSRFSIFCRAERGCCRCAQTRIPAASCLPRPFLFILSPIASCASAGDAVHRRALASYCLSVSVRAYAEPAHVCDRHDAL